MIARTDLSREVFLPGFILDNFLEAKIVPVDPKLTQPVVLPRLAALR